MTPFRSGSGSRIGALPVLLAAAVLWIAWQRSHRDGAAICRPCAIPGILLPAPCPIESPGPAR